MRTVSDDTIAFLKAGIAVDSAFIVGVDWGTGQETRYLDRDIKDMETITGRIVSISEVDSSQSSDSSGQTSAVTVVLSDAESIDATTPLGQLKNIFDSTDIHKKKAKVYQYFLGTVADDVFILFTGVVSTPIIWDEGQRTLTFDIVSKIEDQTIGFSAEFGTYSALPPSLIGQPFPFVFGTVAHVPGMVLQEIPTAFTLEPFGTVDYSLLLEISKIQQQMSGMTINFPKLCTDGFFVIDTKCNQDDENAKALAQGAQLQAQLDQLTLQLRALQRTLGQQQNWQLSTVDLQPTITVRQPFTGTLRAGNQLFSGTINNVTGKMNCTPLLQPGNGPGVPYPGIQNIRQQNIKAGYQFFPAGTQVTIAGPYPIPYAVSCIPGSVIAVYAYQSFHGLKKLTFVPTSLYTVQTLNFGGQGSNCVCVVMKQPLSVTNFLQNLQIENWENNFGQYLAPHIVAQVDWDDQIYVTFESSVGPNPTDIMTYLVDNYSENTIDISRAGNANYTPMNFVYQSIGGVMELLTDLAYQARCAIYLDDDVYKLVFLPNPGAAIATIGESDIDVDTMSIETTATEDLVTQYVASFRVDYSPEFEAPIKIYLRFNVALYGLISEDHDYTAFTSYAVVQKAATFWMIRKSMTWKILKVDLHLHFINLEVFDIVNLTFIHPYISNNTITAMVINAQYDPTQHVIHAEFWTPVRLGEMDPYPFGFFTGTENDIFPTYRDIQSGGSESASGGAAWPLPPTSGTRWNVIPPGDRALWTIGDPHPGGIVEEPDSDPGGGGGSTLITGHTDYPLAIDDTNPGIDPYQYADPAIVPPTGPTVEYSKIYPCQINEYMETDADGRQAYKITIYRHGTMNAGKQTAASQLQIDPDDRIPEGTWYFCVETTWPVDDDNEPTDKETDLFDSQRTLQVPIWLS